jgi:dipeptidyl aminopeptidase/acylaminoacyl peptidase
MRPWPPSVCFDQQFSKEFHMTLKTLIIVTSWLGLLAGGYLLAEGKRPVTPHDCVTVRNILPLDMTPSWRSPIKINPDGGSVAYLVESPNLNTNANDVDLYVRAVTQASETPSRRLLAGEISDFLWSLSGRSLTVLIRRDGRRVLERVEVRTGKTQVVAQADTDIEEFSTDQNDDTIVYTTRQTIAMAAQTHTPQEIARGYRIPFESASENAWIHSSVFVTRRVSGSWTTPRLITFRSPLDGKDSTLLARGENSPLMPTLSPDGSKLLVSYWDFSTTMPAEWANSGYMKLRNSTGRIQALRLLVLYDLQTGETRVPLKTSFVNSPPLWSADSESFFVEAGAEVGSSVETEEAKDGSLGHLRGTVLYFVKPDTNETQVVSKRVADPVEPPLYWGKTGVMLARTTSLNTMTKFVYRNGQWNPEATIPLPAKATDAIAANESYVFGNIADLTTPPRLFAYRIDDGKLSVFENLNPQFDDLSLARPMEVHWSTPDGFNASGILLLPPGYSKDERYPLVIHTKPFSTGFVCSFGNYPSFAPQPIAGAGIMYLGPGSLGEEPAAKPPQKIADYLPKGYPGGISEAAFNMQIWDSAVKALSEQGLIDDKKVGVIGFSRTGWYTEFSLAHSKIHFRAATVSDNVQYSLGEYWLARDAGTMKESDGTYGGPPYGKTLKNWIDYSVSFNLDRIRTPLLMEEMGYGIPIPPSSEAQPVALETSSEVFSGLNYLNRPVELYFYPNEGHTPEHPQARLATMQRNVDWYRFWLQGYERPNPEDPSQYTRWEKMRRAQDELDGQNSPISAGTETPSTQNRE